MIMMMMIIQLQVASCKQAKKLSWIKWICLFGYPAGWMEKWHFWRANNGPAGSKIVSISNCDDDGESKPRKQLHKQPPEQCQSGYATQTWKRAPSQVHSRPLQTLLYKDQAPSKSGSVSCFGLLLVWVAVASSNKLQIAWWKEAE